MKFLSLIAFLFLISCKSTGLKTVVYYQDKHDPWQEAVKEGVQSWGFPITRVDTPVSSAVTVKMVKWGKDGSQGEYHKATKTVYVNVESRQYNNVTVTNGLRYFNEVPFDYENAKVLTAHEFGHYFGLKDYDEVWSAEPDKYLTPTVMNIRLLNKSDKLPTKEDIQKARKLFK